MKNPVIIGTSQLIQREKDPSKALGPLDMLERIAHEAAEDSTAGERVIRAIDTIAVVDIVGWRPKNPNRLVADRLGIEPQCELLSNMGGEMALVLVNTVAERIMAGETKVALIEGTNNLFGMRCAVKAQAQLDWEQGGDGEPTLLGSSLRGCSDREVQYGISAPSNVYPIFENALRARRGLDLDQHMQNLGELMAPFTEVAARNPYAWFPTARSADELTQISENNRMVAYPYPKYLNAVIDTDQAAGLLLVSEEAAEELGVPREKWVYWHGGATTNERAWFVSEREDMADSPAMRECARRTLANANVSIDEIDHLDFYSCFPVAVELACEAYGVAEDDPRGLTVTGGLPYAGGPANNYPLHSLVTLVERLRAKPGDLGLVTGNGWYLTKHSSNVWSSEKPQKTPTSGPDLEIEVGAEPTEIADQADGPGVIEGYTVLYGRDGKPERGIVVGRLQADGRRFVANTPNDLAVLQALVAGEAVGRAGSVSYRDGANVFEPS